MVFQQGDVLLKEAAIPKSAKLITDENEDYVLAKGEVTGHAHKIKKAEHIELLEFEGKIYLRVGVKAPLKHEEHHVIIIEPGEYEVGIVREMDHVAQMVREVRD